MGKMVFDRLRIFERQIVRGDVGNVAVWGDDLADHDKTIGLEPDPVDLFGSPIQVLDADVLTFLHRHLTVALYLADPLPTVSFDSFQVADGGEPCIHKDILWLQFSLFRHTEHFTSVIVLGLAVSRRVVHAVVDRDHLLAVRPEYVYDVDTFHRSMMFSGVLLFYQGDFS
jgi:hypothetical protein